MSSKDYIINAVKQYAHELPDMRTPEWGQFWYYEGAIAYSLIRASNSKYIVELGTYRGTSTKYLGLAALKTGGTVYTYDIDNKLVDEVAKPYCEGLPIVFKTMDVMKVKYNIMDFLLIDFNHHDLEVPKWYIKELLPKVRDWICIHDIDDDFNRYPESIYVKEHLKGQFITTREIVAEWDAPKQEPEEFEKGFNSAVWLKGKNG